MSEPHKTRKRGGVKKPRHTRKEIQETNKILDRVYKKVKTYEDLLQTNIEFLKGKLPGTWYYDARWGEGLDQKTHAVGDTTKTLLALHKKGIFTTGGQSAACGKVEPTEDTRYYSESAGGVVEYEQRSNIDGSLPVELAQKLLPILKKDKRIYVEVWYPKEEGNFTNVPYKLVAKGWPKQFNVTREKTEDGKWQEATNQYADTTHKEHVDNFGPRKYPNIKKILREQAEINVVLRKYCKGPEADKILLDAINKLTAC